MICESDVSYFFSEESESLTSTLPSNEPKSSAASVDDTHMCDKSDETSKEPQRDSSASQTNAVAPVRPKYRLSEFLLFMLIFLNSLNFEGKDKCNLTYIMAAIS